VWRGGPGGRTGGESAIGVRVAVVLIDGGRAVRVVHAQSWSACGHLGAHRGSGELEYQTLRQSGCGLQVVVFSLM